VVLAENSASLFYIYLKYLTNLSPLSSQIISLLSTGTVRHAGISTIEIPRTSHVTNVSESRPPLSSGTNIDHRIY
jgi:hypothetical protein